MSNAISNISAALGYDVAETMLAGGASLAAVLAFESARYESFPVDADCSPASVRDLTVAFETVRPVSR